MANDDRYVFWVHGVDVHAQNEPDSADQVRRNSQGARVRQNRGSNWFHFAVPTPTALDNNNVYLGSVKIKAAINSRATIDAVHIYEGSKALRKHNELGWSGIEQLAENLGVPDERTSSPIVVCIHVEFSEGGEVTFLGVGGVFYRIVGNID